MRSNINCDLSKYENTIIYLCSKLGGVIKGKKKLYKLLYYVDFDMFEYKESMSTITGTRYYAWRMGPVPEPSVFSDLIEKMQNENKIKVDRQDIEKYETPTTMEIYSTDTKPNINLFSEDEIKILDRVVSHYGNLTGSQLETLTHKEAPWISTERLKVIPFELSFYRGTDFSEI